MQRVAIIGGGLMGAGIAQVFAGADRHVVLFEPDMEIRASVHKRVADNLRVIGEDVEVAGRIELVGSLAEAVAEAEFVTEAAPEKLPVKRDIFAAMVACAPRTAILASNTSVIPISQIAEGLDTADRIVGTHWWNPPYLIPLVEVVQAAGTSDDTIRATMDLLKAIGKMPAHVRRDEPGFVANRLQHALWREAIAVVAEGVCDAATLDECVKNSFGLRLAVLGPLENADLVGLDLTLDIHRTMIPALDRHDRPHPYLEAKVAAGELGFKSGKGFRSWTEEEMRTLRTQLAQHLMKARG
jgi:3-hydroxybutyryl-CoA dehydrogenase